MIYAYTRPIYQVSVYRTIGPLVRALITCLHLNMKARLLYLILV